MRRPHRQKVYADAPIFLSVIRREATWPVCLKVLRAAHRGDISLVASTWLKVELIGRRGDIDWRTQDQVIEDYLDSLEVEWVEVDHYIISQARAMADRYALRGGDAVHLASAVRAGADHFMTYDRGFPLGGRVEHVHVVEPCVVWNETMEDLGVDNLAEAEERRRASSSQQK